MERNIITVCRRIISNKQYEEVDDPPYPSLLLDVQTANMLVSVYDRLNEKNQLEFANMSLVRMVDVGWRVINKAKAKHNV